MIIMTAIAICAGPPGYAPSAGHCLPTSIECRQAYARNETHYRDSKGVTHLCPLSKAPAHLRGEPPEEIGTRDAPDAPDGEHE